ncbi:hypothetical protein QYS49_24000 [Marivirga salinae]|uniref:DUF1269 domain-containing protein n=1 Tax=Marivirga salinarum TaxID=3059078 RepID=A0AA49GAI6_9BACT|nr:hypothetical protein [Marivirga sp. BDSF4-3]WKK74733.2 hypothetical protein QYS49_24000 [Marivirga sp. BDSF4-3]
MAENQNQKTVNMTKDLDMLTGMFQDRDSTENAYKTLQKKGYKKDQINVVMLGETLKKHFISDIKHTKYGAYTTENAIVDPTIENNESVISEVIGANGRSVVVRGLIIILAGPIASGISGSGASGIPGGIMGALENLGFSKESANLYEEGIKKGKIVIGVQLLNEEDDQQIENSLNTKKEEIHY